MSAKSDIQWTDANWSPLRARVRTDAAAIAQANGYASLIRIADKMAGHVGPHCERVSKECDKCYSQTNNCRCLPANGTGLPFDRRARDLVELFVDENILVQPLHWRKPRKIFVESQSDLFGEWFTDDMIDRVFAVMALSPQHTFQVLTKRAKRMRAYFKRPLSKAEAIQQAFEMDRDLMGGVRDARQWAEPAWPLPNVWLGVSAGTQAAADERIPLLLQTPAAVRFVSAEPLLEALNLAHIGDENGWLNCLDGKWRVIFKTDNQAAQVRLDEPFLPPLDWVIVGGESGTGARPCRVELIENLIEQCAEADVACFVKQLGAYPVWAGAKALPIQPARGKCGEIEEWPESLRVRQMPGEVAVA